jgi:SNF2 family DNA or RNA helicase
MSNKQGRSYKDIRGFKLGMQEFLQKELAKISTQRKRKDIMPWLPEKDYQEIKLPLTPEQTKYLYELERWFETEHIITQGILDRLVRYRQICLHPGLLDLKGKSPKLEWIKDYINDYPDKPILIFSKFTSFIKILEQELHDKKLGVIIGDTPIQKRNELKLSFQKGDINILILNIDAGKESLTLDRAETAIFTDKYPPASDIQQAEDRFVATTEAGANKPHLIIELMMKGSYDEELYNLVKRRVCETDVINDYKKYLERRS